MRATDRVDCFMTEAVLSINVDEPAGEVLRLFAGYPVHHMPVLSNQKVVGMLSSADVMKIESFLPRTGSARADYLSKRMRVADLMRKPPIAIRRDATLLDAARAMAGNAVHALPVVDEQERLLGIITTTDVMHAALEPPPPAGTAAPESASRVPQRVEMSPDEFERALSAAKTAVAAGEDVDGIAMGLLHLQRRVVGLEQVLQTADRYLKFGQDPQQHAALRKAVGEAKRIQSGASAPAAFGLGD